jgi:hypothetical protein
MPFPKQVVINGQEIDEAHGVNISVETPTSPRGDYNGRTHAVTVEIYRRASKTPTISLFENATNQDGRFNSIDAKIVLQNSKREETYTFDIQECFISEWSFTQPENDDLLYEVVKLKVGKLNVSSSSEGSSTDFTVREFNRNERGIL